MKAIKKDKASVGHLTGNRKVAKSRGKTWRASLVQGKYEAKLNPSALMVTRLKEKLSQADIAKKVGISPASYGAIERAKRFVSEKRVFEIAEKLNKRSKDLFKSKDGKKFLAIIP